MENPCASRYDLFGMYPVGFVSANRHMAKCELHVDDAWHTWTLHSVHCTHTSDVCRKRERERRTAQADIATLKRNFDWIVSMWHWELQQPKSTSMPFSLEGPSSIHGSRLYRECECTEFCYTHEHIIIIFVEQLNRFSIVVTRIIDSCQGIREPIAVRVLASVCVSIQCTHYVDKVQCI